MGISGWDSEFQIQDSGGNTDSGSAVFVEGGIQGGVPDCRDWIQDMILINYASQGEIAELSMGSPYGKKEVFLTSFIQYVFVIFIICKQRTFLNNLRMTKI